MHPTPPLTIVTLRISDIATTTPYQLMPPLAAHELAALRADIDAHGVLEPIHVDEQYRIIAGHHRVDVCRELGIAQIPAIIETGLDEAAKRDRALVLELARRHLNQDQKRTIIQSLLVEASDRSDRDIARLVAVSPTTVGSLRARLEARGTIPSTSLRVGADARTQHVPTVQSGHPLDVSFLSGGGDPVEVLRVWVREQLPAEPPAEREDAVLAYVGRWPTRPPNADLFEVWCAAWHASRGYRPKHDRGRR